MLRYGFNFEHPQKIWLRQGIMSSEVGDPEARGEGGGKPQMGNPSRGSADVKSILGYPNTLAG